MKKIIDLMLGKITFFLGLLWLITITTVYLWPASWWLEVDSVRVADGVVNKPVVMYVHRTIHRNFVGTWGVTVRALENTGTYVTCAASAVSDYRIGTDLPEVITLGWWTDGRCETLPAGTYLIQTTWQIHNVGIFPTKTIQATSNPFVIYKESAK